MARQLPNFNPLKNRRKSDAARRANQVIRSRTMLMMAVLGVGTFLALFGRLYHLQVNRHGEMQDRAVHQQTLTTQISASRGAVYDKNHNVLAISATAETIFISPMEVKQFVEQQEESIEEASKAAAEKGKQYTPPEILDQAYIARGLSHVLGLEEESILELMEKTWSQFEVLNQKAEKELADEVRRFINGELDDEGNEVPEGQRRTVRGVFLRADSKRYYPYNTMAANVIGFVDGENKGGVGLEAKYNGVLSGESGMTVSAKVNKIDQPLLFQYEQYYDAQNGNDLLLTLDINVQIALEKGLESMLSKFNAANGGTGIVMDVKSGAILGMASYPNYDSNQYGTLYDEKLKGKLAKSLQELEQTRSTYETEEDYNAAVSKTKSTAVQTQWRNKCIDSTYEPGSTFKPITLAAALEEGLVNMNSTFQCNGSITVKGWDKPINCSRKGGHGHQVLKQAVGNSCNRRTTLIAKLSPWRPIPSGRRSMSPPWPSSAHRPPASTGDISTSLTSLSRSWTATAILFSSMSLPVSGRSSARRLPPRSGNAWNTWWPPEPALTDRSRAIASAAKPVPPTRPEPKRPRIPRATSWCPSCALPRRTTLSTSCS